VLTSTVNVTWAELEGIVRASFEVVATGDRWIVVRYRPDSGREPVNVRLAAGEALARPFVAIVAEVFAATELDHELALAINYELLVGSLELANERYFVRAMLPLTNLDPIDLGRMTMQIGIQAAHMRQQNDSERGLAPQAFAHWEE
jgi:hypothetical protein